MELNADTKLGDVLDRWPALEQVLLDLSPAFRALRAPVVRKALGRAATLRQAARAGGVSLALLLSRLREAAGLPPDLHAPYEPSGAPRPPAWAIPDPSRRRDARLDVEAGVHPLPLVLAELEALAEGETYELLTPLVPAPLIDLARRKGFEAHAWIEPGGHARTVFRRAPPGPGSP
ncbi:MAG: DUF1858 domain-containing protein [Anaeromyxobacteraceae bacterium]